VVFDEQAAHYERTVDSSISFTGRDSSFFAWRKVLLLRQLLESQGRELDRSAILDVGCGTGTTDRHLANQVKELHGVDISNEMLAIARESVPTARFQCYDGKTLPFPARSFDVVVAICVLHHVAASDQSLFVAELQRVARPGGLIVVFEHNPANPLTRRAVRNCELDIGVTLLSSGDVKRLFTKAGCQVLERQYFLFTPLGGRIGPLLDRVLRRVPLGGQHVVVAEKPDLEPRD
jgi:ubiquinone/menaquinone biosynthesis C-methylase UbiE